jgi:glyoxylate reductase
MSKPRVFISRIIAKESLDKIAAATEMEVWQDELPPPYEVLLEKARDAEGLVTLLTDRIDAAAIERMPRLRVISNMAVGYDNIDIAAATARNIVVGYTPGVLTETTADLAFTLMVAAARRIVEADNYTRQGKWKTWGPMVLQGQDIYKATLGIVGLGRIGAAVARRARGFDMKILYFSRHRRSPEEEKELGVEYVPEVSELLSRSDFISINVPLTSETKYMIGDKEFDMMKPNAVFVNTSRGTVVDQKALYRALKDGKIFAAGIDVTETEPISPDDPLLTLSNIIIPPHIGSSSFATRTKMAMMVAENLLAGLSGEIPPDCVNPEALKS